MEKSIEKVLEYLKEKGEEVEIVPNNWGIFEICNYFPTHINECVSIYEETVIYKDEKDEYDNIHLNDLIGKTLSKVEKISVDEIIFTSCDGTKWTMYHEQDCCEEVTIEDICGDLNDLVGSPIIMSEVVTNNDNPKVEGAESWTWTFYKFATVRGYVTIRWYGVSNGYYSEKVSFNMLND